MLQGMIEELRAVLVLVLPAGGVSGPPAGILHPLKGQPLIDLRQPLAVLVEIRQREARA